MRKRSLLFVTILLTTLVVLMIWATLSTRVNYSSRGDSSQRTMDWISSYLDLTVEQRGKLDSINEKFTQLEKVMKEDRQEIRDKLIIMFASERLDQVRILEIIDGKQKQLDQFAPTIVAEVSKFHTSLTPEQRKMLSEDLKKHALLPSNNKQYRHRTN